MRISGPRFTGSFVVSGNSHEEVLLPLVNATDEDRLVLADDTLRVIATKPVAALKFTPFPNGEGMDERPDFRYWIGRALTGDTAKRFLLEVFGFEVKSPNASQSKLDTEIETELSRRVGPKYLQDVALYQAMDRFARENMDDEPVEDLTNKDELMTSADSDQPDWGVSNDDWRGDVHGNAAEEDATWDLGNTPWKPSGNSGDNDDANLT